MNYYFLYMNKDDGKIHRRRFDNIASAVNHRKYWCNSYAYLQFPIVKRNLEKSLDVKVDTAQKAEELFENLFGDAERLSAVMDDDEFRQFVQKATKSFEKLKESDEDFIW